MKPAVTAALVAGAVCAVLGAVIFWPSGPKCDAQDVVATVESLAADKISGVSNLDVLLKNGGSGLDREILRKQMNKGERPHLAFDSFRERGSEGRGVRCAAIAYVLLGTKRTFEVSTEYSVEPTSDGKTIVTARFMPN